MSQREKEWKKDKEDETMKLGKQLFRFVCLIASAALIIQLAGCGTIFYPERRGQTGGRVDIGIAILDACWLFLFIIPGLVAFGVDLTTGAIYMPGGRRGSLSPDAENMTVIHVDPKELNNKTIEDVVRKYTGCSTDLSLSDAEIVAVDSPDKMATLLAELRKSGYRTR
jgi:hypothetical protein